MFKQIIKLNLALILILNLSYLASSEQLIDISGLRALKSVYDRCIEQDDFLRCLKIQAVKITDRASHLSKINITDGITLIETESSRAFSNPSPALKENELENLSDQQINKLLIDKSQKFFENHEIQFSLPQLLDEEESRGKKNKGMGGLIMAAIAMKAIMMKAAYTGIAMLAGKALIIGKIALVLSAIIGLKKLVSSDGHEKTTYEIVKHPHVSHSNTYSSSHYGDFDEGAGGGHYHRSFDEMNDVSSNQDFAQDKAYSSWVPKKY